MTDNLEKAFEAIYESNAKAIFRFIYFKTSSFEEAEDLTSETFLKFWKQFKKGEEIKNTKAFLYTIANGLVIDFYRSKKNKNKIALDKVDERLLTVEENFEEKLNEKDDLDQVYAALKKIKKEYQDALLLHYVEDLTIAECAEILGKTENTLRVLLHRSVKALKGKL